MPGIYLHIPFCKQACNYCDFHFSTNLSGKKSLVDALCKEIDNRKNYLSEEKIDSIYFGGGTPSLLSAEEIMHIMHSLRNIYNWDKNCEITLEANPDDINIESLKAWKDAGINRLSIGLQSFNDEELKWMNRAHNAAESLASVALAQSSGFKNISIDLIYGSKFQTLESWEKTLETAISLGTQHISSYNLTIENKTALGIQHLKGKEPAINDDFSNEQFLMMIKRLSSAGFVHYEISNFGLPNYFARHNSNYWLQKNYIGFGPSAHSFDGVSRQWNVKNNKKYVDALSLNQAYSEKEELSIRDRYNEYVMTRLRTIWGCNLNEIKSLYGSEFVDHFQKSISVNKKYLKEDKDTYTLNAEGRSLADGIAADFFVL